MAQADPTYGDYRIAFAGGVKRTLSAIFVSRKVDSHGVSWVSVRGHGTDFLYRSDVVTSITKFAKSGSGALLAPAELPLRTPAMAREERRERDSAAATRRASVFQYSCDDPTVCGDACDPICGCGAPIAVPLKTTSCV